MIDVHYETPRNGLHVCGKHAEAEAAMTVACYPMAPDQARAKFAAAKAELESQQERGDLVLELCIGDEIVDDCWIDRQMLDRLDRLCTAGDSA